MIRIKIEGKNIADLWSLACVRTIAKTPKSNIEVAVRTKWNGCGYNVISCAYIGDTIETESEQSEHGRIIEKRADLL